jgi:hypothetical protein
VLTKTGIHNIVFSGSWFLSFFQLLVTLLIFGVSICDENRPMEVSSKKPVSRYREVVHVPKKEVRDPRFNQLGGTLDVEGYKHLCLVNLKLLIMHSLFLFQ